MREPQSLGNKFWFSPIFKKLHPYSKAYLEVPFQFEVEM